MIVVADTSPINYLLLINQIDLLPQLFEQVIIPDVVCDEMRDLDAPPVLQQWIADPPSWLMIQPVPIMDTTLNTLDHGEQAAITLAQILPADLLIIDERLGRRMAEERGIAIIGTVGVLDAAATLGLVNLAETLMKLQETNFRVSRHILQTLLNTEPDPSTD